MLGLRAFLPRKQRNSSYASLYDHVKGFKFGIASKEEEKKEEKPVVQQPSQEPCVAAQLTVSSIDIDAGYLADNDTSEKPSPMIGRR